MVSTSDCKITSCRYYVLNHIANKEHNTISDIAHNCRMTIDATKSIVNYLYNAGIIDKYKNNSNLNEYSVIVRHDFHVGDIYNRGVKIFDAYNNKKISDISVNKLVQACKESTKPPESFHTKFLNDIKVVKKLIDRYGNINVIAIAQALTVIEDLKDGANTISSGNVIDIIKQLDETDFEFRDVESVVQLLSELKQGEVL